MAQAVHIDAAEFAVEVQPGGGGAPCEARTVNISAGGAKIVSDERVALREELRLEIRFEGPTFLVFADATVVRIERSDPQWVYVGNTDAVQSAKRWRRFPDSSCERRGSRRYTLRATRYGAMWSKQRCPSSSRRSSWSTQGQLNFWKAARLP